jgi:3-oxoacyl-[acyl-carrier protein] reductase
MSVASGRQAEVVRYPDLAGKVAVVTGGSRGLGAATAHALAENDAQVAVVGRDDAALGSVVDGIRAAGGRAIGIRADCTRENDVRRLAETVTEEFGAVDILAAFAGGNGMPVPTMQENPSRWSRTPPPWASRSAGPSTPPLRSWKRCAPRSCGC